MAAPKLSFLLLLLLLAFAMVVHSTSLGDSHFDVMGFGNSNRGTGGLLKTCDGAVGQCIDEDEETMIESGSADMVRRALRGRGRFISYGAMRRNQVPCNTRGSSYYHCGRASGVNPYNRGCSKITRCYRYLG